MDKFHFLVFTLLVYAGNPWQVAGAALFSMVSHLVYTAAHPIRDHRAHVLQHVSLGLTTLNYFIGESELFQEVTIDICSRILRRFDVEGESDQSLRWPLNDITKLAADQEEHQPN